MGPCVCMTVCDVWKKESEAKNGSECKQNGKNYLQPRYWIEERSFFFQHIQLSIQTRMCLEMRLTRRTFDNSFLLSSQNRLVPGILKITQEEQQRLRL